MRPVCLTTPDRHMIPTWPGPQVRLTQLVAKFLFLHPPHLTGGHPKRSCLPGTLRVLPSIGSYVPMTASTAQELNPLNNHRDEPITYSFSEFDASSMLLLPPPEAPDSRPVYHISVQNNIFRPPSHITVIRRGGSRDGQFIAEFE